MKWSPEREARAGLCAIQAEAHAGLAALVVSHGANKIWQTLRSAPRESRFGRKARQIQVDSLIAATDHYGLRFVIPSDEDWPEALAGLDSIQPVGGMAGAPFGLWISGPGSLGAWSDRAVAVVGSRASTSYGDMAAADLAYDLAAEGWTIVSGGAYGIDLQSHRSALAAGGQTIAVLANGLDQRYPRGNTAVLDRIATSGLLVSELPPGANPTRPGFLARNRIIAALSAGTIVVEASARSGARNTATWAGGLGRIVMAVPGPVTSASSVTPHRLIRDGEATLVSCATDARSLLEPLGKGPRLPVGGEERPLDGLSPSELTVRESLPGRGTRSAGEVALVTGLDLPTCLATLGELEMKGLVSSTEDGRWRLLRPTG